MRITFSLILLSIAFSAAFSQKSIKDKEIKTGAKQRTNIFHLLYVYLITAPK
jgi:hypothetical protein